MKTFKILSGILVFACALTTNAANVFKASTNVGTSTQVAFSIDHATSINFANGLVTVTYADGNTSSFPNLDPNGSVRTKIQANYYFQTTFVYNSVMDTWYSMESAKSVVCGSNQTSIRYTTGAGIYLQDNCTLFNTVIANAN